VRAATTTNLRQTTESNLSGSAELEAVGLRAEQLEKCEKKALTEKYPQDIEQAKQQFEQMSGEEPLRPSGDPTNSRRHFASDAWVAMATRRI